MSVSQALSLAGLCPEGIGRAARAPQSIAAYLEMHIEQGPCLEHDDAALGVVTAINGARRLNCVFQGTAGHAGTVPMTQRQDALAAAAQWMVVVEQLTREQASGLVATIGMLQCAPGAANVIPGEVRLTLDVRGLEETALAALLANLLSHGEQVAQARGCRFEAEESHCPDAL